MSFLTWFLLFMGATWLLTPGDVVRELREATSATLNAMESTARVIAAADPLTVPARWVLKHPPTRDRAALVLARARAGAAQALAQAEASAGSTSATPKARGFGAVVEAATVAVTRSLADAFDGNRSQGASSVRPDAWGPIHATLEALKAHRDTISGLAFLQLFYLWIEASVLIGFVFGLRVWRGHGGGEKPSQTVPPTPLIMPAPRFPAVATAIEARLHPDLGPAGRFLKRHGLPQTLAFEVDRHFKRHSKWPGSLRGHDTAPGDLARHSVKVGRIMAQKSRGHALPVRRAAVFLGAVHDLGKTITYQPTETGWVSSPASPHDALSARVVRGLVSFNRSFPGPVRRALLHALENYHSPELCASNAAPLARTLLTWLREADSEAAGETSATTQEASA